jgi:hypothetical protein
MEIGLERYPFEWAEDREPRLDAVRNLVSNLAKAARWTGLQIAVSRYRFPPLQPFSRKAFDDAVKKVALQRFNANVPAPVIAVRTGRLEELQYPWSLAVCSCHLFVFAHDTTKNRLAMNRLFGMARKARDAAVYATLSHGYAGVSSWDAVGLKFPWGPRPAFFDHDKAQLTPPWRAHLGRAWLDVPGAMRFVDAYVGKQRNAVVDPDGLLLDATPARVATDRSSARRAAWRAFSTLHKRVAQVANDVYHDRQGRKQLRAAGLIRDRRGS